MQRHGKGSPAVYVTNLYYSVVCTLNAYVKKKKANFAHTAHAPYQQTPLSKGVCCTYTHACIQMVLFLFCDRVHALQFCLQPILIEIPLKPSFFKRRHEVSFINSFSLFFTFHTKVQIFNLFFSKNLLKQRRRRIASMCGAS